ncbi:helix-turn-helix transcriptional regulator [Mesosutterella sp. OilRF-GAM-744-9]|uniref:Helix-turn-helix transcriptional regulator n=1 Tax=Mesosutterella porci TaxID=2915351 RepID=A0ABS9MT89_9BURK|nr:helix-turn-helix domain-containing protein [Mesosutterella sp. oilRF-744-WT-GAM-9]MCG5031455.1 helix-turn-helix transcriptional regulator [Mesosutterella sp. oilRF-744-WT-GAM-9]MCI6530712.1 helix-turn-helix transcriptional regulator [Mesosutterella sp.]
MMEKHGCECCAGHSLAEPDGVKTYCPVETTLGLIGGKYKALIVWRLMEGPLRFSQLSKIVKCASPRMLTRQLRELEADGLVSRRAYAEVPVRVEYSLTRMGESIYPILSAMYRWGSGYLAEQGKSVGCAMRPPQDEAGGFGV